MRFLIFFLLAACPCFGQFDWKTVITNAEGQAIDDFLLETSDTLISGTSPVNISFVNDSNQVFIQAPGYGARQLVITPSFVPDTVKLEDSLYELEEVLVSSVKLERKDPFTFLELGQESIDKINLGQDIPMLLQRVPGVIAHSDAGNGIGYTYLRIRGSDQTRINVTINGIPINDSESHGVFWVNMPDISASAESIQVQRGVGGSNNGAGAFGASVNIKTTDLERKPYAKLDASVGSFNAQKYSFQGGTGLINGKFAFDGRISTLQSDGYVDRASADLQSYYLSGAYVTKNAVWRLIHFGGSERTYQSWWGVPEAKLKGNATALMQHYQNNLGSIYQSAADSINLFSSDRRYNYYEYEDQVDDYGQKHYQMHYSLQKGRQSLHAALHYTRGEGFFEEFKPNESFERYGLEPINTDENTTDIVRRRWLDNHFYGLTWTWELEGEQFNINAGGAINQYLGDHFGEIIWSRVNPGIRKDERYYFSDAVKDDRMIYARYTQKLAPEWEITADVQLRSIDYETSGTDNDLQQFEVDENWLFFNPKLGLTYQPNNKNVAYASLAVANREPVRGDLINNPEQPLPERLYDLEVGWRRDFKQGYLDLNYYYMHYDNQLVPTGDLNDVGAILRTNVPESFRTGLEIATAYRPYSFLEAYGSFNISQNKIRAFDEILFDYTNGFERLTIAHENTDIAYSPDFISSFGVKFIWKAFELDWQHRYTSRQYLDNTENQNRSIAPFYVSDVNLHWESTTKGAQNVSFHLQLNNIFNVEYETFGYTYSYRFGQTITENFLYPQATFHWMAGLKIML